MLQEDVRKAVLKALFSDSRLCEHLVLKGGNALALVYGIGNRASLDLDFSIAGDWDDSNWASARIERVLRESFDSLGVDLFDFSFSLKPRLPSKPWWGGYLAEFKLIPRDRAVGLGRDLNQMRRQALTVYPGSQRRKYRLEISKFEFVEGSVSAALDNVDVMVYSPELLAAEKLRALVQQHPDYSEIPPSHKHSRSRDLYDIWVICEHFALRLEEHLETVREVFNAKRASLALLGRFAELEALHGADWADVENSVYGQLEDFSFYFRYVEKIATRLYSKWIVDAP